MFNPNLPLKCPICQSSSKYEFKNGHYECGCSFLECSSPRFIQNKGDSIYLPRYKWDNWVNDYKENKKKMK